MTIAQLIQAAPAKANELFAKLSDTTVRAVKTRERLLADLRDELHLQMELEEKHLFPALRRHAGLKGLVDDAAADNKTTRALLTELERMPTDDEGFAGKVKELRRVFQQHIRDERKELLPAIRKMLSGEEAQAVADRMEAGRAEIADARRQDANPPEPAPKEHPPKEPAHRTAGGSALREASAAIAGVAGKAVESVEEAPRLAERTARAGSEAMARSVPEAVARVRPMANPPMANPIVDGFETLASIPGIAASATSEAGRVWAVWAETTCRSCLQGAQELASAPTPLHATEVQQRLMSDAMRAWFDAGSRLMEIAMHASRGVMAPIERQTRRLKGGA